MKNNQLEKIVKLLNDIDIDICEEDIKDITSVDELEEYLQNNNMFDVEIIYYSKAMEYLMENDTSLTESLRIASEMGYSIENLSSEVLASLLASENIRNDFYNIRDDIEAIYDAK
jgi:ribosome-interacting GTPase 1